MRYCLPALSLGALLWIALPSSPSSADPGNEDKPAKKGTSAQAEKKDKKEQKEQKEKKEKKEKKAKKDEKGEKGEAKKLAEKDEAKKSEAKKADEKKAKAEKADDKKAKAEPAKAGTKEDKKVKAKAGKEKTAEDEEQEAEEKKPAAKKADQKKPDLKKDPKKAEQKKDDGEKFPDSKVTDPRGPDLSEAPRRTAVGFEKVSKEKRAKAEKIVTAVLKKLKGVAAWNLDSSSRAQVQAAVKRIKAEGKKLDEAGDLFTESFNTEKLSLKLYIRAAQVRELTTGKKTDVTKLNNRLADLTWGKPQAPFEARVKSVKLLVDALAEYIQGHLAEAIVLTSKSVEADKNQALSYAYQGSFYYLTQNKQLAIQAWTKALRLDPSNEEVRQALKSLGSSEK